MPAHAPVVLNVYGGGIPSVIGSHSWYPSKNTRSGPLFDPALESSQNDHAPLSLEQGKHEQYANREGSLHSPWVLLKEYSLGVPGSRRPGADAFDEVEQFAYP